MKFVSPNYDNFHPFGCRVHLCLHDYMPNKNFSRSIPCNFLDYSSSYKGFRCLDPTTSKLYIIHHAQIEETHFPFLDTSQAQPISSLQFSNFLEPNLPLSEMLPSSPAPHSRHIAQSGFNSCGICIDLVDEYLQAHDYLAGPSLLPSNPSLASLEPTT